MGVGVKGRVRRGEVSYICHNGFSIRENDRTGIEKVRGLYLRLFLGVRSGTQFSEW